MGLTIECGVGTDVWTEELGEHSLQGNLADKRAPLPRSLQQGYMYAQGATVVRGGEGAFLCEVPLSINACTLTGNTCGDMWNAQLIELHGTDGCRRWRHRWNFLVCQGL